MMEKTHVVIENINESLETVIGGGDPAAAQQHYDTAMQLEQEGFRVGAIAQLRSAVASGSNPDHVFKLAYLLDLVGEEMESTSLYEEPRKRRQTQHERVVKPCCGLRRSRQN